MADVIAGEAPADESGDVLVVPVFGGGAWGPGADWAAAELGEWVDGYLEDEEFTGKSGQLASVPGGSLPYDRVLFVGLGDEVDLEGIRRAAGSAGRTTSKYERVVTTLHQVDIEGATEATALGWRLGQYRFDKYLSDPKPLRTETVLLAGGDADQPSIARGTAVAAGVALARDLINEPAAAKAPEILAGRAVDIAEAHGIAVRVYDESEIEAERFGGLAAVNAGATNPARMVVLRYTPEGASRTLAMVGKGIVFDSGGLSIKPAKSMETMKVDMSGAAAVYGAMQAIATLQIPVNVIGITPLTENLTGGAAQRPGDVMRARNGKTIEVLNTDAEGRLILADGLSLAAEDEPDLIVDIATLTGACAVALGPRIAGLWTNSDAAADEVVASAAAAGEKVWRMPLEAEYRAQIDSNVADMKNTGEREGSAITAALLLEEFVGDVSWVHLDIAGPARAASADHYLAKGGTGFGVRTLVELAASYASR